MAAIVKNVPYDFANLEIDINNTIVSGLRGISWEHGFEVEKLFAAAREAIGRTEGVYNVEDVELTLYESSYHELITALGAGYMTEAARFPMSLSYAHPDAPTVDVQFQDCRIIKDAHDHQQGAEGLECSVTLSVMKVVVKGIDPAKR